MSKHQRNLGSRSFQAPVIAGVSITTDAEGRFNLNALHRASGLGASKAPSQWLRTQSAQDLIRELEGETVQISIVSIEGRNGGTFAHELLAISYAGWISAAFQLQVNQVFIDYRTGKLESRHPHTDVAREVRLTMGQNLRLAKMLGLDGNQAVLSANRATVAMTGVDMMGLLGVTHMEAPQGTALLTPTEIGRRLGAEREGTARRVNQMLCDMGFQQAFRDAKGSIYYEPTEAGRRSGAVMLDTGKKHSNGTPVRQLKWSSDILAVIEGR